MPKAYRVAFMITANELKAIEDWRGRQDNLPSRAVAIRRLIRLGVADSAQQGFEMTTQHSSPTATPDPTET
jgi:hypothetical protein